MFISFLHFLLPSIHFLTLSLPSPLNSFYWLNNIWREYLMYPRTFCDTGGAKVGECDPHLPGIPILILYLCSTSFLVLAFPPFFPLCFLYSVGSCSLLKILQTYSQITHKCVTEAGTDVLLYVLGSYCCCNKSPQMKLLKTIQMYYLIVLYFRSLMQVSPG